jgi:hypothetical protein
MEKRRLEGFWEPVESKRDHDDIEEKEDDVKDEENAA